MRFILAVIGCLVIISAYAQDDLLNELEKNEGDKKDYVIQTFKGTRIVNGHSIETKSAGSLEFIISHRFGAINSGSYDLWGLDFSTIRLGLEYGITDRLGVGIGRSSLDKTFDTYVKYKALRQSTGSGSFPFTLTLLGNMTYKNSKEGDDKNLESNDRIAYVAQALFARKFSPALSLQLAPLFLHRNTVDQNIAVNDLIALGVGGRVKITRSVAISGEYYARLNEKDGSPYKDAIGLGIDIETGGHVFQLIFTNSIGMTERIMVAETPEDFFDGDIHFGFNITRTFQLSKKNAKADKKW